MEDSSVSAIYRSVIDTVIERVKPDFVQEGVDESILDELRLKWEKKLKESGALEPEPAPAPPRYQQKLQQPARQMPPLPAFLSNLTAQQPAAANPYAMAGSPAQYLQPRQPQGAITTPQLPVMTGVPLGAPPVSVALPSDRLHPHLLSNTGPNPQQQYQRAYYAPPANTYTAPPQQQPQHAGASSSSAMPSLALYKQQPQVVQQGFQQQVTAQGSAQLQQQQHLPRQQQPHSQQHLNGAQQARQQPNLQSLLSIQGGYSAPAPDSRKRKAEDEHSALFSLLPDSTPSVPGSSAPSIPQQDGPGDDEDDKDEATDDEKAEKAEKEDDKGETFSDVSSEPEEEDDQQIANIVVGQFEKVARSRQKWKVHLKDGVMRINGKDHLFHTAVGDMLF